MSFVSSYPLKCYCFPRTIKSPLLRHEASLVPGEVHASVCIAELQQLLLQVHDGERALTTGSMDGLHKRPCATW